MKIYPNTCKFPWNMHIIPIFLKMEYTYTSIYVESVIDDYYSELTSIFLFLVDAINAK